MRKFKKWLYGRFLPEYCRLGLLEENKRLADKIRALEQKNRELSAYIDGLETGIRAQKRIVINTERGRDG